jgi:hypothetical protein
VISVQVIRSVSESLSAYCLGRILAERFGWNFRFPQLRNRVNNWSVEGDRIIGSASSWIGQWPFDSFTGQKLTAKREAFTVSNFSQVNETECETNG